MIATLCMAYALVVCMCLCVRVCVHSFWYAVQLQTYAVTNVSLLFRFRPLSPPSAGEAIRRMGTDFKPRSRRAFDAEKLQRASGLEHLNDSMLLITYGISGCVCAKRYVCVEDVMRLLERKLVVDTL